MSWDRSPGQVRYSASRRNCRTRRSAAATTSSDGTTSGPRGHGRQVGTEAASQCRGSIALLDRHRAPIGYRLRVPTSIRQDRAAQDREGDSSSGSERMRCAVFPAARRGGEREFGGIRGFGEPSLGGRYDYCARDVHPAGRGNGPDRTDQRVGGPARLFLGKLVAEAPDHGSQPVAGRLRVIRSPARIPTLPPESTLRRAAERKTPLHYHI